MKLASFRDYIPGMHVVPKKCHIFPLAEENRRSEGGNINTFQLFNSGGNLICLSLIDEREGFLLRIEVDDEKLSKVEMTVRESVKQNPYFSRLKVGEWFPEEDAKKRILEAGES